MDVGHAAEALEQGRWRLESCDSKNLPIQNGFVVSPQAMAKAKLA
jgi:hypothetical protein